jgi:hypothetical protein
MKRNRNFLQDMMMSEQQKEQIFLSLYPNKKKSVIASGATPIGSAGCAPNEITDYKSYEAGIEVHCRIP